MHKNLWISRYKQPFSDTMWSKCGHDVSRTSKYKGFHALLIFLQNSYFIANKEWLCNAVYLSQLICILFLLILRNANNAWSIMWSRWSSTRYNVLEVIPMHVSIENLSIVRDYIILGYMLDMALLPKYKHLEDLINRDLVEVRKELRKRDIKVLVGEQSDFIFRYIIWHKGYESNFGITRDVAKTEIGIKMGKLMREYERK